MSKTKSRLKVWAMRKVFGFISYKKKAWKRFYFYKNTQVLTVYRQKFGYSIQCEPLYKFNNKWKVLATIEDFILQ